jgi:hypothetical protein
MHNLPTAEAIVKSVAGVERSRAETHKTQKSNSKLLFRQVCPSA